MKPSLRNVDFNLLLLFEAIYRARNLTVAGQMVGISPSAASHALARLRDTFGDPLFVRLARSLEPTPLADEIAGQTTAALDGVRAIFDRTGFDPATAERSFRIAMSDTAERLVLPDLCRHLHVRAPGVSIETCAPPVRTLQQGMENGSINLAFGYLPNIRGDIKQQHLYDLRYACIVSATHPAIRGSLSREQYLAASHAVAFPAGSLHGENIEGTLRAADLQGRIALRVRTFLAMPEIISRTDLVAAIPRSLADTLNSDQGLQILEPPIALPRHEVNLYWHERYNLEPGNRWMRGLIATQFQHASSSGSA